ncbi:MAG TPA: PLD nuclease N-terminal domain-containing protein, partial [Egibacteraceae bacterium]|nr:PLD nuclease N-terminal domain-containing protein [Egibacteraceae bacterium]
MDAEPIGWFFGLFGLFFVFVFALAIGGTALWIWMLVDCVQVPDDRYYRSGSKLMWVLIIALGQVVGALIYLGVGRPSKETRQWLAAQRAAPGAAAWGAPAAAANPPPTAPP